MRAAVSRTLYRHGRVHDGAAGRATALAVEDGRVVFGAATTGPSAFAGATPRWSTSRAGCSPRRSSTATCTPSHRLRAHRARPGPRLGARRHPRRGWPPTPPPTPVPASWSGRAGTRPRWPERRPPTGASSSGPPRTAQPTSTRVDGHSSVDLAGAGRPGARARAARRLDRRRAGRARRPPRRPQRPRGADRPRRRPPGGRAGRRAGPWPPTASSPSTRTPRPTSAPSHEIDAGAPGGRARPACAAVVYWGELLAVDTARRLGVAGLAGDLVADGAFGSRTAALTSAYADAHDTCGHAYLTAEQVRDHVVACTEAGLQAGFHCIGDAALDAVAEGFRRAEELLGAPRRRARPPPARARRDALGRRDRPDGRPGGDRQRAADVRRPVGRPRRHVRRTAWGSAGARPTRSCALDTAGVRLAFGSDSPGHRPRPLGGGACRGRAPRRRARGCRPPRRSGPHRGGAHAALDEHGGSLTVGARADLAVWDVPAASPTTACPTSPPEHRSPSCTAGRRRPSHPPPRGGRRVSTRPRQARPRPGARQAGPQPGPQGRPPDRDHGQEAHHRLRGAGHPAPRRPPGRRRRGHALGQPADGRRPRATSGSSTAWRSRCGTRCCAARPTTSPRWHRRPLPARSGSGCPRAATPSVPAPPAAVRSAPGIKAVDARRRRARADDQAARRRPAPAVDLPDRRHRRHPRGHPAGPAGRPRGRRRDRGDPLDRPEPARLRARGRHPRGLRRHLRHPGELPADAGRARRVEQGARPLRPAHQLRLRAVHARDRRRWRAWSGST